MRSTRTRIRIGAALLGVIGPAVVSLAAIGAGAAAADDPPAKPAPTAKPAAAAKDDPNAQAASETIAAFAKAFNAHDPAALSALFYEEAELVGSDGATTRGRAEIAAMFASSFEAMPSLAVEPAVTAARSLTPEVVRVEGSSRMSGASSSAHHTNFDALLVRKDGAWKIAELRDTPQPEADVPSYERLRDLEWMVGEWVSEGDEVKVSSSVKWADNKSFLVRTYKVELPGQKPTTGTMFIGWSPESDQIKSWVFDSDGGHGEGLWSRAGDQTWVVDASGVLRDGRASSATQIHTLLSKDSVRTSSIDRIIGGQVAPDMPEVVMVRKPPAPAAAEPAPPR